MLYNIVNGFKGVIKRKQEEILYLISTFDQVLSHNLFYVYFDGHGYHNFSETFNTPVGLDNLDWDTINSRNWFDTEEDSDRKRRKQAELLIHNEMPFDAIQVIGVYNQNALERVNAILQNRNCHKNVIIFKGDIIKFNHD